MKYKLLNLLLFIIMFSCSKETEEDTNNGGNSSSDYCFELTEGTLYADMQINFDASCSDEYTYYEWDFGDEDYDSGVSVSHTYEESGTYKVILLVGNDYDNLKSVVKTIEVYTSPFVEHCESIEGNETWEEGLHIVGCDIEINGVLTIEPGATIYIEEENYIKVNGKLLAEGTGAKPIIFTAANNSSDPGSWGYIQFSELASNESILNYCEIKYGGKTGSFSYPGWDYYSDFGVVHLEECAISIKNTTIESANNYGISLSKNAKFVAFENNTFKNNTSHPLKVPPSAVESLGTTTVFENEKSILVDVQQYFSPETDVMWYAQEVPYYVDYSLDLTTDVDFTIEAGTIIEMDSNNAINSGYFEALKGRIIAIGTEANPIVFTSAKEEKNKGDWAGIIISDDSILEHCIIEYAGSDFTASGYNRALQVKGNGATLNNCTINECSGNGIEMDADSAIVTNNLIKNCDQYGVVVAITNYRIIRESNTFENTGGFYLEGTSNIIEDIVLENRVYPYIVDNVYFGQNSTLTVDAGVEIQIRSNSTISLGYDYNVSNVSYAGSIIANGTERNPIVFTLYDKDREEGNENWGGFIFSDINGESLLEYCLISEGGYHFNSSSGTIIENIGMIHCNGTDNYPIIKNCTISNSASYGITLNQATINGVDNTLLNNVKDDIYSY